MKYFASVVNVLALSAMVTFASSATGEQNLMQNSLNGKTRDQPASIEVRAPEAGEVPLSTQTQNAKGMSHERISPEYRRQLRRDINDAGRDIYTQDRVERPRRF